MENIAARTIRYKKLFVQTLKNWRKPASSNAWDQELKKQKKIRNRKPNSKEKTSEKQGCI